MARDGLTIAFAGASASFALSILPFSPLLGGALSGALAGPRLRRALLAGTLSGLLLWVPSALVVCLIAGVAVALGFVTVPGGGAVGLVAFVGVLLSLLTVYTVGLSALGGLLGPRLARAYPDRRDNARRRLGLDSPRDSRPRTAVDVHPDTPIDSDEGGA